MVSSDQWIWGEILRSPFRKAPKSEGGEDMHPARLLAATVTWKHGSKDHAQENGAKKKEVTQVPDNQGTTLLSLDSLFPDLVHVEEKIAPLTYLSHWFCYGTT